VRDECRAGGKGKVREEKGERRDKSKARINELEFIWLGLRGEYFG
jgi:hypothetical protein